jgi:hypothetical protein
MFDAPWTVCFVLREGRVVPRAILKSKILGGTRRVNVETDGGGGTTFYAHSAAIIIIH